MLKTPQDLYPRNLNYHPSDIVSYKIQSLKFLLSKRKIYIYIVHASKKTSTLTLALARLKYEF